MLIMMLGVVFDTAFVRGDPCLCFGGGTRTGGALDGSLLLARLRFVEVLGMVVVETGEGVTVDLELDEPWGGTSHRTSLAQSSFLGVGFD